MRRDSRLVLVEDEDELEPLVAAPSDGADDRFDRATVAAAFADLPPRWQHVLWHTAVEGMAHEEVGEALGLTGNAVGVLAHRAREGLRTAYLDAHLAAAVDERCRRTTPLLGAYVRGAMSLGKRQGVTDHLADCGRCRHAVAELGQISANLGAVLLPCWGWSPPRDCPARPAAQPRAPRPRRRRGPAGGGPRAVRRRSSWPPSAWSPSCSPPPRPCSSRGRTNARRSRRPPPGRRTRRRPPRRRP
ncbi:zf-HC2 domain-containing protein [Nocardioides zeae]